MIIGKQGQKIKKYIIGRSNSICLLSECGAEKRVTGHCCLLPCFFFFFSKNVKASGELKNIPNTRTLEVYVPVWDKSISRDWYDSCHLEILFLIIGDAVAG